MNRYNDLDRVWDDRTFGAYASITDHPWRWVGGIVAVIIGLTLLGNALDIVSVYWNAEKAKATVNGRVTQATYGTDNALSNIAYFHNQCNTILTDQQNVVNAKSTLATDQGVFNAAATPIGQEQAGQTVSQDETALLGSKDQLSTDVRDYDAKSATQTANPFKAANLPYRISINPSTGLLEGSVNCH